jgi:hypothetical protein
LLGLGFDDATNGIQGLGQPDEKNFSAAEFREKSHAKTKRNSREKAQKTQKD